MVCVASSSRSASVDLPWSMCATMLKLRMRSGGITGRKSSRERSGQRDGGAVPRSSTVGGRAGGSGGAAGVGPTSGDAVHRRVRAEVVVLVEQVAGRVVHEARCGRRRARRAGTRRAAPCRAPCSGRRPVVSIAARWLLVTASVMTTLRPVGTLQIWKVTDPLPPKPRITIGCSVSLRKVMSWTQLSIDRDGGVEPVGVAVDVVEVVVRGSPISRPARRAALKIVVEVEQMPPPIAPPATLRPLMMAPPYMIAALDGDRPDAVPEAEPLAGRQVRAVDVEGADVDVVPESVALAGHVVRRPARDHLHLGQRSPRPPPS